MITRDVILSDTLGIIFEWGRCSSIVQRRLVRVSVSNDPVGFRRPRYPTGCFLRTRNLVINLVNPVKGSRGKWKNIRGVPTPTKTVTTTVITQLKGERTEGRGRGKRGKNGEGGLHLWRLSLRGYRGRGSWPVRVFRSVRNQRWLSRGGD